MSTNPPNNSGSNNHTDSELDHSAVKTQMNVEFVEQQPVVQDDARLGYSLASLPASMESAMPDESWMAAKQLSKPVVIRQFQWNADAVTGSILNNFDFPQILTENDSIHQETLRMYSFFKFNWTLRFQINGTKFHSGQLLVSFDPFSQATSAATGQHRPFGVVYATGLPNVMLNASSNQPVELTIPFVHPRNFLTTNSTTGFDTLGTIRVSVLNPLRAATGSSQSLSITTWLYADSPSVHVPIYRHDLTLPAERAVPTMDFVKSIVGDGPGNLISDVGSTFGNLATGNFGGAIKSGGKSLTGLASMLGLDYPSRPEIPQSHINSLGPMSPGKGVDASYRLGTDPRGGHVPTPDQTGCTRDECDLDVIKKVPMLFRQVLWTDSNVVGTILTYFPVTPNICAIDDTVGQNTFLSWLSNGFCFWRGALTYKLEWISTQFHTGRVLVAFIPNQFSGTPTLQQAFSVPNAVIDLQQSSVTDITVPFVSSTVWKRTDTDPAQVGDQVVGYVYIYVLNDLVRPSNVADTIEFNIYIHGEDDFEFAVPRANALTTYRAARPPPVETAVRTSGVDRMETRTAGQSSDATIAVAFGKPLVPPVDLYGEKFTLVDYMKRYSQISGFNFSSGADIRFFETNVPTPYRDAVTNVTKLDLPRGVCQNTALTTVTAMFACWFGSLRYKVATDANRALNGFLVVTYNPLEPQEYPGFVSGSGYPIQRTNLAQNNSLDIELPCYTQYNLLLLNPSASGQISYTEAGSFSVVFYGQSQGETFNYDLYQAAGDDFRPFYLISPPADFENTSNYHFGTVLRA